jgi:hypothetical protein
MPTIVELTPITQRGHGVLDEIESRTGELPFTIEATGARAYALDGAMNVGGFKAGLDVVDPDWERHLAFSDVSPTR